MPVSMAMVTAMPMILMDMMMLAMVALKIAM